MNNKVILTVLLGVGTSIIASVIWDKYKANKAASAAQNANAPAQLDYFDLQFQTLGKYGAGLYQYTPPNVLFNSAGVLH